MTSRNLLPLFDRETINDIKFSNLLTMIYRSGGVIEVGATIVRKTYPVDRGFTRVTHLKTIYELLARKSVPNVDNLFLAHPKRGIVYLQPRGLDVTPKIAQDVVDAILCVLEALEVRIQFIHVEVTSTDVSRSLCMPVRTRCSTGIFVGQIFCGELTTPENGFSLTGRMLLWCRPMLLNILGEKYIHREYMKMDMGRR